MNLISPLYLYRSSTFLKMLKYLCLMKAKKKAMKPGAINMIHVPIVKL